MVHDASTRIGSMLVIGDWGFDSATAYGGCKTDSCQRAIAQKMHDTWSDLGDVKFIVNVGDSFYPDGVTGKDDPKWDAEWRWVYSDELRSVPWYSVYGNHDYHHDPGACSDNTWDGAQINDDAEDLSTFFMPNYSWYKEHPELQLEVVAMDLNTYSQWPTHKLFEGCQYSPCEETCGPRLKQRSDDAFALLKERVEASTAQNLLVFSHYPTDYFRDTTSADPSADFLSVLSDDSRHHIVYFGGHRHNVDQDSTISIAPNENWLVGGGGGWGVDGKEQGFVVVEVFQDGFIKTGAVLVDKAECYDVCQNYGLRANASVVV